MEWFKSGNPQIPKQEVNRSCLTLANQEMCSRSIAIAINSLGMETQGKSNRELLMIL